MDRPKTATAAQDDSDYSLVYLPVSLSSDVLAESEFLMQQLSSDMEAAAAAAAAAATTEEPPKFMEVEAPSPASSSSSSSTPEQMQQVPASILDLASTGALMAETMSVEDHGYLNGILNNNEGTRLDFSPTLINWNANVSSSVPGSVVKNEPRSPQHSHFPPSPSGSDSSNSSSNPPRVLPPSPAPSYTSTTSNGASTAPLSPPYSPTQQQQQQQVVVLPAPIQQQQIVGGPPQAMVLQAGNKQPLQQVNQQVPQQQVLAVKDIGNLKIPIPKVTRPGELFICALSFADLVDVRIPPASSPHHCQSGPRSRRRSTTVPRGRRQRGSGNAVRAGLSRRRGRPGVRPGGHPPGAAARGRGRGRTGGHRPQAHRDKDGAPAGGHHGRGHLLPDQAALSGFDGFQRCRR